MKSIGLLCIAMLFLCGTVSAERTVWYVHPDSALNEIQAGLDSCADNDIVLVAPGTYFENLVWPNTQGIHLISELGAEYTIVDGDSAGNVVYCATGVDTTTVIRGFTIQNGNVWGDGGGIHCSNVSSPTISNNIITGNRAYLGFAGVARGGGIFCDSACSPIISYNTITNNTATAPPYGSGGGIFCRGPSQAIIRNNTITNNSVSGVSNGFGAGICCGPSYSGIIIGNTITGNSAFPDGHGGGIACRGSSPVINSCTISDNIRDGIYCEDCSGNPSNPVISYNDICDNIGFGVRNVDTTIIVSADSNWWGDATGPYHPTANPGGLGDSVSDYVDFDPWLSWPVGVEERPITESVEKQVYIGATIFSGPLQLPKDKKCRVFDITGRVVQPNKITRGIYFIEIDGIVTQKVVKVR